MLYVNFYKIRLDWNRLPKELKYFYEKGEKKVKRKMTSTSSKSTKTKAKKIKDIDVDKITEVKFLLLFNF
jgi:hypothetical protein